MYVPVTGIFKQTPIYDITENTREEDKDVITAASTQPCVRKTLFEFKLPSNIKSLRMECKVRTTRQPSTDAYILFRNKTTGYTQHLRSTNFPLNTAWSNVTLSNLDLLNSGYLRPNVEPHPDHEIEIYAEACFRGWTINVKGATLIYEI